MAFRLVTLGSLGLDPIPENKSIRPKDLALLAYLRIETGRDRTRSLDQLHNGLFAPLDRKRSTALSQSLSRLRAVLGDVALPEGRSGEVALHDPISCDATDLLEAERRRDKRAAALAAYRGEFLTTYNVGSPLKYPEWHKWLQDKRRRFKKLFLDLSELEARDLLDERRWEEAEAVVERALQQEPSWPAGVALLDQARASRRESEAAGQKHDEALPVTETIPEARVNAAAEVTTNPPDDSTAVAIIRPSPEKFLPTHRPRARWLIAAAGLLLVIGALAGLNRMAGGERSPRAGGMDGQSRTAARLCGRGEARAHRYDQDFKPNVANVLEPGERFSTAWHLQNVSSCSWDSTIRIHKVRETSTHPLTLNNVRDVPISRVVSPGDTVVLRVAMQAPGVEGSFGEDWELLDGWDALIALDDSLPLRARIRVQIGANAPTCMRDSVRAEMVATNFPDNQVFRPGEAFVYTWTVMNRTQGDCAWDSDLVLRFRSALRGRFSDSRVSEFPVLERVLPSYGYTFEVPMRAPTREGNYVEEWYLTDRTGVPIPLEKGTQTVASITVSSSAVQTSRVRICNGGEAKAGWWRSERVADNTRIAVGTPFVKKWTVPNTGSCMWPMGTHLHYVRTDGGRRLSASKDDTRYISHPVPPNLTYTFAVPMVAHLPVGERREHWALHDVNHNVIPISLTPAIWVDIFVID